MSARITPPWSAAQVEALNSFQRAGRFHPFTCGGDRSDAAHRTYAAENADPDLGLLVADRDGWRCPACSYRQAWAHAGMALAVLAPAVTEADRITPTLTTVTRAQLIEVLGLDDEEVEDGEPGAIVRTCIGEWRREAVDLWRAWDNVEEPAPSNAGGAV